MLIKFVFEINYFIYFYFSIGIDERRITAAISLRFLMTFGRFIQNRGKNPTVHPSPLAGTLTNLVASSDFP